MVISNREVAEKAGISSIAMAALTAAPVGWSLGLSHKSGINVRMQMPGTNVWAARYHLLDARFVELNRGDQPSLPASIVLHPDFTSRRTLRKANDEDAAEIGVVKDTESSRHERLTTEGENNHFKLGEDYEDTEKYEDDLEIDVQSFEEILKEAAQAATSKKSLEDERRQ
jgi:hypothetical protein